jgi:integrase
MRNRKQAGQIIRIGDSWYVRYWERRNINRNIERKRVTHQLGPVTTRGKHPPADIQAEAEKHMHSVNNNIIQTERILLLGDFVEQVYLPHIALHKRPSTSKSVSDHWRYHLNALCKGVWLKDVRTFDVQQWLNEIATEQLGRNTLKHIKSTVSGIFKLAKQLGFFVGENPVRDTALDPRAAEPALTYAYSLEELQSIVSLLPEPSATMFAIAAFAGLRAGEIQGLLWEDYQKGEIFVSRSIWNGRVNDPKTRKGRAPVPVIQQLAQRLEMHRLRCGNPQTGPIFANAVGKPLSLANLVNRDILPALHRCRHCGSAEGKSHLRQNHDYQRDERIPEWHGWHSARRGLGSNLYRLGVADIVIQRILRHANVSTTATYYIKSAADDVRKAMAKLENSLTETSAQSFGDSGRTLNEHPAPSSSSVQ